MNVSNNDKATADLRYIEKALKVAWVLYVLALFYYGIGAQSGDKLTSQALAAVFAGVSIYCTTTLTIWRFRYREAALSFLRERWIKCLIQVCIMSALIVGPILLSILLPVEK